MQDHKKFPGIVGRPDSPKCLSAIEELHCSAYKPEHVASDAVTIVVYIRMQRHDTLPEH